MPTVLVLPSEDPRLNTGLGAVLDSTVNARIIDPEPGPGSPSARACSAINALAPTPPLTVVAFGETALVLPALALSQRTAHRRVMEYVLVDPRLPAVTESWPDARVTIVTDDPESPASLQGRLRGWRVIEHADFGDWTPDAT